MADTSPHLTAWDYEPTREEGCSFIVYPATTSEPLAYVADRSGAEDIARVMAAGPELLAALERYVALDLMADEYDNVKIRQESGIHRSAVALIAKALGVA